MTEEMSTEELLQMVAPIVRRLWPMLRAELGGKPPQVQAAVLADLTAIWLAGHIDFDDPMETHRLREELLMLHIDAVQQLILPNELLGEPKS
jgi:hypothetical protein